MEGKIKMKYKQTRRSVSISGDLYDRLKAEAVKQGTAQSAIVECVMRDHLGMQPRENKLKSIEQVIARHTPKEKVPPKLKIVEVIKTSVTVSTKPKAKVNGTKRIPPAEALAARDKEIEDTPLKPPKPKKPKPKKPELTYGMDQDARDARKVKIEAALTRAGNIFTF